MARTNFSPLADGLSTSLGDEVNDRMAALKDSTNEALVFRGDWTSVLDVRAHDLVLHNGVLWEALADSVNVTPIAGTSWRQVLASGSGTPSIITVTATGAITATTDIHQVNTASATTQTLPLAPNNRLGYITVKNLVASTGITMAAPGGTTLESGVPMITAARDSLDFYLDGTTWRIR